MLHFAEVLLTWVMGQIVTAKRYDKDVRFLFITFAYLSLFLLIAAFVWALTAPEAVRLPWSGRLVPSDGIATLLLLASPIAVALAVVFRSVSKKSP
jgi:hypothetical protein